MSAVCAFLLAASVLLQPPATQARTRSSQPPNNTKSNSSTRGAQFVESAAQGNPTDSTSLLAANAGSSATTRNASSASTPSDDLGPTTAVPWNPSKAVPRRNGWETAVGLPGRLLTLPLVPIGWAADRLMLRIEEGNILSPRVLEPEGPRRANTGIKLHVASLGDHTGFGGRAEWLTRVPLMPPALRSVLSLSHAASTAHYHDTRVVLSGQSAQINYHYEWRPQEQFYGLGMNTTPGMRSSYATQSERVQFQYGYGWNHDELTFLPRTNFGGWVGTDGRVTKSGREAGIPPSEEEFPELVAGTIGERHEHLIYGFSFSSDWRTGVPHRAEGWRVLVEAERHDEPEKLAALKTNQAGAQFTRATYELEKRVSFMRDPRTLQFMARVVDQHISHNPELMELADYASLGGHNGLGGFEPGRFHDLDLVYGKVAYIFPLVRRFEIEMHGEVGETSPDVWRASRFDQLQTSVGIGLRGRGLTRALGYLGFEFSHEAVRFRFHTGDPDR